MCKLQKGGYYYWKLTGGKEFIFSSQPIKLQAQREDYVHTDLRRENFDGLQEH